MTLARRLVLGSLVVVLTLLTAVVLIAGGLLRERLLAQKVDELSRTARLIADEWRAGSDADVVAHRVGDASGVRVTLIRRDGVVLGDSEFERAARRRLENHLTRPEIVTAGLTGAGSARRRSASAGDEELYYAVRHPLGYVRVSVATTQLDDVLGGALRDVLLSGLVALAGVLALAVLFARSISRPIVELGDTAQAIARGDLSRRPPLSAPGEVGDLATALHRMTEQLATRLEALEADDHLMTAVLESLEEGVLAIDERGMVVRINQRGRMLLDAVAPLPFARELLPRDPALRGAVEQAMAGRVTMPDEVALHERTVAVASRPLAPGGAVVTVLDLTVLRKLETIRRDFVANVSHELKTPLTAVSGFAETLLDDDIPADQRRQFAETIRDNAWRMQRIVDDLLDLSRIESGGWRPNVGHVEIAAVVRDVFAAVRERAEAKSVRLEAVVPPDAAIVQADPTAFRQILSNLVENAVQYTHSGLVTLAAQRAGTGLRIDVRDTGIGIAAEHVPRIFERFYRADPARSREHGGTGLGLAIVRHLVEAHGGRVEAVSVPGRGTTISVFLPAVPAA